VIIIGAGISGLSAANYLKSNNYERVLVIESRDRVGGRINSVEINGTGAIVDLGASWIHGVGPGAVGLPKWTNKMNPIYDLAK